MQHLSLDYPPQDCPFPIATLNLAVRRLKLLFMRLSLSGKVALVTGGSRGIGAAVVRMFVGAGAQVLFSYEKSKRQAEALVAELSAGNAAGNVSTVGCNLSGTETARELV